MADFKKTVLMLQPLWFQALVWRSALTSQQISVLWGPSYTDLTATLERFKSAEIELDLLLIDLEINNYRHFCWECRQHYPDLKIILTSNNWKNVPPKLLHHWATHQGIDAVIPRFKPLSLASDIVAGMRRVLEILGGQLLNETTLIPALLSIYQNLHPPSQELQQIAQLNLINSPEFSNLQPSPPKKKPNSLDPILSQELRSPQSSGASFPSFGRIQLLSMLIIFALLDICSLWLIAPALGVKNIPFSSLKHDEEQQVLLASTFKEVTGVPRGVFNYGGSTTWAPIRKVFDTQLQKEFPDLKLRYLDAINNTPGSGTGIRLLLEGELDFAQSSRALEAQEYESARQQGFTLRQYPVAIDAITVVVHPSLSLPGLTINQLRQIYLGQVTNWKQVGGTDLAIIPLSRRPKDGGTVRFFQENVLQKQAFGAKVKYVYSTTDGLHQLSHTPGGIYYASAAQVVNQCTIKPLPLGKTSARFISPYREPLVPKERCPQQRNQLNTHAYKDASYPITRNLFVIVKQDGDRAEEVGETYVKLLLSDQGQQLIEQAGFVRLR
jgi:phosphate transport system substrate-binding protein